VTTSTPTDVGTLDRLIEQALADLRIARVTYWRARTPKNQHSAERAEQHLNALLDYRSAAMHRGGGAG
jgi:hypothetical protein